MGEHEEPLPEGLEGLSCGTTVIKIGDVFYSTTGTRLLSETLKNTVFEAAAGDFF